MVGFLLPIKDLENNSLNIQQIMRGLSNIRPVFHSEADFQHALAWQIQNDYPEAQIRLEINLDRTGKREYLDILVKLDGWIFAIELKYKTRKFEVNCGEESFVLLNHSAQDCGRYDFIKDIARLERFTKNHPNSLGYAIMLTNECGYWNACKRTNTFDRDFRINEGRTLKGTLRWNKEASEGTIDGRASPLVLNNLYKLNWKNYSETESSKFKYLLLEVK